MRIHTLIIIFSLIIVFLSLFGCTEMITDPDKIYYCRDGLLFGCGDEPISEISEEDKFKDGGFEKDGFERLPPGLDYVEGLVDDWSIGPTALPPQKMFIRLQHQESYGEEYLILYACANLDQARDKSDECFIKLSVDYTGPREGGYRFKEGDNYIQVFVEAPIPSYVIYSYEPSEQPKYEQYKPGPSEYESEYSEQGPEYRENGIEEIEEEDKSYLIQECYEGRPNGPPEEKENCFYRLGFEEEDVELCSEIKDGDYRDVCLQGAAISSQNSSICAQITDEDIKYRCLRDTGEIEVEVYPYSRVFGDKNSWPITNYSFGEEVQISSYFIFHYDRNQDTLGFMQFEEMPMGEEDIRPINMDNLEYIGPGNYTFEFGEGTNLVHFEIEMKIPPLEDLGIKYTG